MRRAHDRVPKRRGPPRALSAMVALSLGGCVINGDRWTRPIELSVSSIIDRTRILAIRAEPAEIAPGEEASLEALIARAPDDDGALGLLWLACPEEGAGCNTDLGGFDLETSTPEELEALGFIGFEPGLPPSYGAPSDLLDVLDDDARLEGLSVLVQLTAFPLDELGGLDASSGTEALDFNLIEAGYKRLIVSEASTPNHNPQLTGLTIDRLVVPSDVQTVRVEPNQLYELGILLGDALGRETYEFRNSEGIVEERIEEPYASWFSTDGEVVEPITLWPYMESTWLSPDEEGVQGTWYVVVRDRRGGMSWWVQDWQVGTP